MKLYNTLTGEKDEFIPIKKDEVSIYVCGPTVYNFFHIGNARPFIIFDVLRRYLEYKGYKVNYVQNFTDIDDKIINKAKEENTTAGAVADKYIDEYFKDADALGIKRATIHPKVSDSIDDIIALVQDLINNGFAYNVNGNVYYRVSAFKDYGKLSGKNIDELESGARVEVNDEKESPLDFALWKKQKNNEEIAFDSPFGKGRPGWHIECSAMSRKHLGETIDIHGGGEDLVFPHHENEIAQSEGATGKTFVNYFIHNAYININNEKMSKSKGNFFTVRDISKKFDLEVVRLFMLSAHYKTPVNFSYDILKQNQNALERLYSTKENLLFKIENAEKEKSDHNEKKFIDSLNKYKKIFDESMEDDLNTANAISALFEMGRFINSFISDENIQTNGNISKKILEKAYDKYMNLAGVLGLLYKNNNDKNKVLENSIQKLIDDRNKARKNKDFVLADKIRDELKEKGIIIKDTREGVQWKKIK